MIILGLDPGTATTGFGVIDVSGKRERFVDCGVIETPKHLPLSERLHLIHQDLKTLLLDYKPKCVGVESLFFTKNVKTALAVGHARGVVLQQIAAHGLELFEFTPSEMKQMICGYGNANKASVQDMVVRMLGLDFVPQPDDAADALAIALCVKQSSLKIPRA